MSEETNPKKLDRLFEAGSNPARSTSLSWGFPNFLVF
jgi:hypothetical protein